MSPESIVMEKGSILLSRDTCSATAKPRGMTVPISASTAMSVFSLGAGTGAALKVTGAVETPQDDTV